MAEHDVMAVEATGVGPGLEQQVGIRWTQFVVAALEQPGLIVAPDDL
jgi:hypothetical protein